MKRFIEDKLYVQVKDITFLLYNNYTIPNSLRSYLMANHLYIESNEDDVFICFTNPIDINYLNGVDFITDYDVYKNVSIDILEKIIENLTCRIKQLELRINNSTRYNEKIDKEYMLITHKACDISNIYLYRMNKINLYIPGEKYEPLLIKKIKHKIGRGKTDEKNSK